MYVLENTSNFGFVYGAVICTKTGVHLYSISRVTKVIATSERTSVNLHTIERHQLGKQTFKILSQPLSVRMEG